jgi:hypothetical protein
MQRRTDLSSAKQPAHPGTNWPALLVAGGTILLVVRALAHTAAAHRCRLRLGWRGASLDCR